MVTGSMGAGGRGGDNEGSSSGDLKGELRHTVHILAFISPVVLGKLLTRF